MIPIRDLCVGLVRLVLALLIVVLIVGTLVQVWFTWNRALDGEKAWICLQQPQPGCGVAAPPPQSKGPAPSPK